MSKTVLVAYDGSSNADDAVALGRLLAQLTGSELALAHIYRAAPRNPRRGEAAVAGRDRFLARRGEELLEHAAVGAGGDVRRVVLGATTTATGMRSLAEREGAVAVVFGSASNTEPGRVHPGSASRRMLQGSPSAVAFAPVGYRASANSIPGRIGVVHDDDGASARLSAEALASAIGSAASAVEGTDKVDLVVIGSRPNAETGRVMIAAGAEPALHAATSPVVVLPRGVALPSAALASAAA